MSKASQPELKKVRRYCRWKKDEKTEKKEPHWHQYMDKRLAIALQGGRRVSGVLRGFDIFLNLVVDNAVEEAGPNVTAGSKAQLGQIVRFFLHSHPSTPIDS